MQISKIPLLICALAWGAAVVVRAEDTPAQAAARAALEAKMKEINSQPPPAAAPQTAPAQPAPVDKAKIKAEKLKAKQAAAELKARQEAEKQAAQKQEALAAQQKKAAADQAAAEAKARTEAEKQAAQQQKVSQAIVFTETTAPAAPVVGDTPAQAAARAALLKQLQSGAPQPTTPPTTQASAAPVQKTAKPKAKPVPAVQPVVAQPSKPVPAEVKNYPGKELGLKPIAAPASPLDATKEQKLQALLVKYKADQLSPEEYHQQRAAILAAP